jgi:hypothetical protein
MKRIILLVVLFLVVGIATFGQTAFIRDKDGSIKKVLVQELPKADTLCIIEQNLSTIPGTAEQQWWALQNPGRDTLVDEVNVTVYSKLGFSAQAYKKEIWLKSDGQTLASYPKLIPCGQERPAWEIYLIFVCILFIAYIFGRYNKLDRDVSGILLVAMAIFGVLALFIGGYVFFEEYGYFSILAKFFSIVLLLIFLYLIFMLPCMDLVFENEVANRFIVFMALFLLTLEVALGVGLLTSIWWIVLILAGLFVVGYIIAYHTTKKKTEPEHTNEAVKTND